MRVAELFEDATPRPSALIASMLLKLYRSGVPLKVRITGIRTTRTGANGFEKIVAIPDQEWNITKVTSKETRAGELEVRVHNDSPDTWFELLPEDDAVLAIKDMRKEHGYWLLTSKNGKGVKL